MKVMVIEDSRLAREGLERRRGRGGEDLALEGEVAHGAEVAHGDPQVVRGVAVAGAAGGVH